MELKINGENENIEKDNLTIAELLKIKEWKNFFKKSGFKKVKEYQFCPEKNWKGTLVIEGSKI